MALRPLVDTELEQFGLENDAQAIQEAAALKPLAPKQVENLKLLRKGTMAYNLAEKYKEAWGLDAETFAQRAEVKDTTGLPDFVLDRKPEIIKETIDKKKYENAPKVDWDEMEKAYPITGNFLGANMNFAWDDIDNLKKHESLWSKLGTSFKVGMDIGTLGRLGERQMYFNREDPELEKTITTLEKSIEERKIKLAESGLGERMVQGLGEITGQQGEAIRNAAIYGSLGMLLGGPFGGLGGLAVGGASAAAGALSGLTVGATFGAAKSVYSMEAGNAWREFRQIPGMDDDSAALAASIVGLGNAGIEMLTFKSIVNPFKTAFAKMGIGGAEANRKAMLMLLQRPTVQKAFKDFVKTYGKNYIENVAQEVAQQGVTQFGGILAADLSDITGTKYTDLNQFMTALYEEAKGAAEMFALVPMLGSATNLSVDLTRANRAVQNTELFNELASSAKDSKVRQRLPRAYRELIASATKDGGLETIYIDSEKFQTVFGQSAADVAEELGITDEYENSLKEGGDLAVNTAVYAEKIAGTDAHAGLAGGIRLKEGEMTADEAQEFLREYEANKQRSIEEAKEAIAKEDEYGADLEMVRQETKNMLLSNGLSAEEAESNALLWSAWVNVLAKQRGVMPSEQNKEIGMRIGLPEDGGVTLGQTENEIKQRQFEIISTSNPMKDDIHTGIRTIEDIKTALEVFSESTDGFTDDFTKEDMDNALARDEVIVYSSNPITNGVFVTPSKQEAESYSGGGMVYSMKVRLGDIAWIDEGQGQYAPTSDISTPNIRYQSNRGQVSFTEGQSIISFFKSRDASTFAHEMGHIMLKMTERYALQSAPDSQMFKDWAVVRNYLSIAEWETLSSIGQDRLTEAHEKFARTFEAYLMTGEAPSVGLRNTFRKFKAWLIGIYKELASLNVEMSPEIKTVFDRMIATEDEIAEVEALANYNKDVSKMENVDMTAEEAELYSSLKEEAEAEARETLLGRLMKPIERMFKKDKQLEYTKAMAKKVKEIRAILEKEPVNRIRTLLAISEKKGGITFDYYESAAIMNDLVSSLGMAVTFGEREISDIDTVIPTFSSRWFRKEGGTDPEVIAMEYGYSSASEMFLDLATARDIDKVAQEKAKAEIDAELNTGIDPESVRLAADKAIRGKNRLELLGIEWLILAKKGKQALKMASARARIQAAKNSAQKHLDGLLWKDAIAFKRFIALERKAALAAERAILNKDMDTALAQKELQIINAALASESMARKTSADIMVKYLKNMAGRTRKQTFGIAPDALEQIDTLLEKYEFKKISEEEMAIRKDLTQWIAEQQELGVPIDLPEDMQRQLKQKNFNSLTYSQIEGLYNTIKAIEKIGKGMMLFKKAEEAQSYDEAVDALKKSLEKQKVTRKHITSSDPNMRKLEALHGMPDAINAQLEKAQTTLLMLDGTKGIEKPGAFTDILWRPFADAIDTKVILLKDYTDRIDNAIFKHYGRGQWSKFLKRKVFIQELGYSLTGEQMFCVYMNLGTETNKVRLMEGKKWSEQQVEAILSKLDKRALDLGQDMRDIIQTLFPMMKALNREVLGYEPKTEEAVPIVTQYGTYRGGYYPLVIDYSKMVDINRTEEYEQGLSKSQPPFRAATRQGAYKARSAHANYQVRLDLGGLRKHLEQVTHDLAFRKAVIDANKILSNKELRVMIAERVGKVGLQVLDNWVRDVATPPATPTDRLSNILRHQRHAVTAAIIMYKLSVLMLQSSGWFNSANILGKKTARAMAMYYARPHTWVKDWKFVMDMSPFMVERNGLIETSMREFLLDKQFGQMSRMDKKIAMTLFNFSDGTITIPTWLEGYRIGIDLYKGDIDKAVGYADDIVRQTQGGSSIIDQSKLQRNQSELTKAISMFTQYFNVVYNLARRSGHNIGSVRNVPAFLGSMMILCVAPAIYEGMLRDDDQPDEDEEGLFGGWGKWASIKSVNYAMATVPILRDIGPYTLAKITGVGYQSSLRLSPMTASLESYIRTAKILLDSDAEWEDKLEKGTESASYITGASLQLHTVAWNLYHYLSDDQPDLDLTDITKKQYRRK